MNLGNEINLLNSNLSLISIPLYMFREIKHSQLHNATYLFISFFTF